ncbi:hypothetical protein J1614_005882 [Plenodomus biglobosus]|nr:hypothetical protein J1614_005882 [Plenodomus biglobosus]
MSKTAEGYYNALFALSGNAALTDGREVLMASIDDKDFKNILQHGIDRGVSRQHLESMMIILLSPTQGTPAVGALVGKAKHESEERVAEHSDTVVGIAQKVIFMVRTTSIWSRWANTDIRYREDSSAIEDDSEEGEDEEEADNSSDSDEGHTSEAE